MISRTARSLPSPATVDLTGQGAWDPIIGTAHVGILDSPWTWSAALGFLRDLEDRGDD